MSGDPQPEPPAKRWLHLAQEDLAAARAILGVADVAPRIACFLSQQAAEKALRAGISAEARVIVDLPAPVVDAVGPIVDATPPFQGHA
jgi:hypothetical protein